MSFAFYKARGWEIGGSLFKEGDDKIAADLLEFDAAAHFARNAQRRDLGHGARYGRGGNAVPKSALSGAERTNTSKHLTLFKLRIDHPRPMDASQTTVASAAAARSSDLNWVLRGW